MFATALLAAATAFVTTNYPSIQAAIDAASAQGGGRIVVPAGRHENRGPIHLRSDCELVLEKDAVLVFSQRFEDYLPAVRTSWEGVECLNYSPLVYAYGATNVAITGSGELRAFEGDYFETAWRRADKDHAKTDAARRALYTWGATDVPLEKRDLTQLGEACTRPQFIQFNRCRNVRLEGFHVRNSPFWTIHLFLCDGVVARDLDVCARGTNNDGIDLEMTRNVLVERCRFDQGDDTFVIKSGRNRDAWRLGVATENVEIRDCHLARAHGFFCVGSEISGGVKNVFIHDCSVGRADRLYHVKTNRRRGGVIRDVRMERVRAGSVGAVLDLETDALYEWRNYPDYELRPTVISDLSIRNVHVGEADVRVDIQGKAECPVRGVTLENVRVDRALANDHFVNVADVVEDGRSVPTASTVTLADFGNDLQRAIDEVSARGCGRIVVPDGDWTFDPVELKSGVELFLSDHARLCFRTGDGTRPLLSANGAENVMISGYGRILPADSQPTAAVRAKNPPLIGFRDCRNVHLTRIALRNTPSDVVLAVTNTVRMLVSKVEFIAQVREDGFYRVSNDSQVVLKGCSFRIGDGRLSVYDPSHRLVAPRPDLQGCANQR